MKLLLENAVDAIQVSKKMVVDTFVKHEGLAKTLNEFVDAQTEYTKKAIDAGYTASTNVYKTLTDKAFYADAAKAMQASSQTFFKAQQAKN